MADNSDLFEQQRQALAEANEAGGWAKYTTFFKLSGPGWIASAITLGGGSLASSLYLGVLGGYSLMWLQPLAMVLGVIMLSAIGYVTLSTGERPFSAINNHVSPVLGWGWALAVAFANIIWCMPQHSLAFGVLSKNLPTKSLLGSDGTITQWAMETYGESAPWLATNFDKLLVSATILLFATIVTWSYDRGGWGLRLYELFLKIIVALIVLCFFGVVLKLTFSSESLPWGEIFAGFIPNFGRFFHPADTFLPFLDAIGQQGSDVRSYWEQVIVDEQRDVMISAAATAVGINMTLMFPYTMLRKGWTKEFRGLSIFDLSTGMFIPFVLATSFVVVAAAATFHTELPEGFSLEGDGPNAQVVVAPDSSRMRAFEGLLSARESALDANVESASNAEKRLAAMLVKRDAFDLAKSLEPLTGTVIANLIFGFGVLAMVLSTISILMLISGFVYAEMLNYPAGGWVHKAGTLVAGVGGALWPIFWTGDSQFYLAIVTSVFGFMLLPFAYITFVFLMNSRSLLGTERPTGLRRWIWNLLMIFAATLVTLAAIYMVWIKAGWFGVVAVALFIKLTLMVAINRHRQGKLAAETASSST